MKRRSANIGRRQWGFTLIEIIVVVALLGIIMSVVSFRVAGSSPQDKLKTEALRMQALIDIVLDEALFKSKEFGIRFTDVDYEFHVYDEQTETFQVVEGDKLLRRRELPEEMSLEIEAEGLTLDDMLLADDSEQPQVLLYSSGEVTPPFILTFRSAQTDIQYFLEAEGSGKVTVSREGSDL